LLLGDAILKIDSLVWDIKSGWRTNREEILNKDDATILFIFGTAQAMKENIFFDDIRKTYPNALLVGGSSAGTIYGEDILDSEVIVSALQLEKSRVKLAVEEITDI